MNNILSLKTVGLSYASTNLSFAFALYFNISMFLLYHNPPLFSITRRTCPNVFLFGVQIPVDACTFLGLKRRSFLFVIDKNNRFCGCFCIRGSPCVLTKKRTLLRSRTLRLALRSASKLALFAISSLCSFRLPPGTPVALLFATPQLYLPFGKLDCFAVIFCFAKLNFHFVKVKANIISLLANG